MVRVSPHLKHYRRAQTLLARIASREDYAQKFGLLQPKHQERIKTLREALTTFTQLDSNEIIQQPLPWWAKGSTRELLEHTFEGIYMKPATRDGLTRELLLLMKQLGQAKGHAEQSFRVHCEAAYRARQNWYIVFNTLTVRAETFEDVFSPRSKAFAAYIRHIDRDVNRACRNLPYAHTNHTYVATIEAGSQTGRLHIHVLHFLRALPGNSRDPNRDRRVPNLRQVDHFRCYWPHGFSTPIAVRYSASDAFGRAGWRWPIDRKTNAPYQAKGVGSVAGYVVKYIMKAYASDKRKDFAWRTRKSRHLGQALLSTFTQHLSLDALRVMATDTTLKLQLNRAQIPPTLQRLAALLEIRNRISSANLLRCGMALAPRPSLLQPTNSSTENLQPFRLEKSTGIGTTDLSEKVISDARAELIEWVGLIDQEYFPHSIGARAGSPLARYGAENRRA